MLLTPVKSGSEKPCHRKHIPGLFHIIVLSHLQCMMLNVHAKELCAKKNISKVKMEHVSSHALVCLHPTGQMEEVVHQQSVIFVNAGVFL